MSFKFNFADDYDDEKENFPLGMAAVQLSAIQ